MQRIVSTVFLILIGYSFLVVGDNAPRSFLGEHILEVSPGSSTVWDLNAIFSSYKLNGSLINSYSIVGESPCIVQESNMFIRESTNFLEMRKIKDFDLTDTELFYLSNYKVYSIQLSDLIKNDESKLKKVLDVAPYNFTTMRVASFSNKELVFFFMNRGHELFYIPFEPKSGEPFSLKATDVPFYDIKEHTKIKVYQDYIFIPTGRQGLFVYKYDTRTKSLEYIKTFDFTTDTRDFFLQTIDNRQIGIVADYTKGLILFDLSLNSMSASNMKTHGEFTSVRSIAVIDANKVLMLIDTDDQMTKQVLITLRKDKGFSYDYTKLLGDAANYIDSSSETAAIVTPNKVVVVGASKVSSAASGHLDNQKSTNAKIRDVDGLGKWLFGVSNSKLFLAEVALVKDFLMCYGQPEDQKFTVLGRSNDCAQLGSVKACDYEISMRYRLEQIKPPEDNDTNKSNESKEKPIDEPKKEAGEKVVQLVEVEEGYSGSSIILLLLILIPITVIATIAIKRCVDEKNPATNYEKVNKEMRPMQVSQPSDI